MGTIKTTFSNNIDATGKLKEGSLGFSAGTEWQSVFTGDGSTGLTTVAGRGYFIDTTSGTVTVTLPASPSAGDYVVLKDYARTWATNKVTIASTLMDGATTTSAFSTNGQTVTIVYMDGTKGWTLVNEDTTSKLEPPPTFISATGGTVTESGDYKIHTFTGDDCFVVSTIGTGGNPSTIDYLVVAGGGGGGRSTGGGGGAGGYRESSGAASGCYTVSPLGACVSGLTLSVTTYPITVGAGGAAGAVPTFDGGSGSNSVFSTITSTGGGGGGGEADDRAGLNGGSGGGGSNGGGCTGSGGSGNTPPVNPPQGQNGGASSPSVSNRMGGGGGGATGNGNTGSPSGGAGGAGGTSSINATPTARASGGGGGGNDNGVTPAPATPGGGGVGGNGNPGTAGTAGTTNTGGGGGGGGDNADGGAGGSGIVIIRYKYQ